MMKEQRKKRIKLRLRKRRDGRNRKCVFRLICSVACNTNGFVCAHAGLYKRATVDEYACVLSNDQIDLKTLLAHIAFACGFSFV